MSINTGMTPSVSMSLRTFFTKEVFPQRRGEIKMVLMLWVRLALRRLASSFLLVKCWPSTALPKTKGLFIVVCCKVDEAKIGNKAVSNKFVSNKFVTSSGCTGDTVNFYQRDYTDDTGLLLEHESHEWHECSCRHVLYQRDYTDYTGIIIRTRISQMARMFVQAVLYQRDYTDDTEIIRKRISRMARMFVQAI